MALDLLRGTATNAAFPPNPKAAVQASALPKLSGVALEQFLH
jgi:hypothetical protein